MDADTRPEPAQEVPELRAEVARLREALHGCADMLHESAKQFRAMRDLGHASMAECHRDAARALLDRPRS